MQSLFVYYCHQKVKGLQNILEPGFHIIVWIFPINCW